MDFLIRKKTEERSRRERERERKRCSSVYELIGYQLIFIWREEEGKG